ncbi:transporter substrate-binding protein [Rummeliibacillus sp. JY-2-4R]
MIKIGGLFSLTGTTSITERGQYQAALFALQEYNQSVTEKSKLVEFIICDIQSDPQKTYNAVEKLIENNVKIFIGTYTSACRKALLEILEKNDCYLIYPSLYEGQELHPNVFYAGEVTHQQIYPTLRYIMNNFGPKLHLIGNDYIYPKATNKELKRYWEFLGGQITGEDYVPFGHENFEGIFSKSISQQSDAIFSTLVGDSLIHFYRIFKRLGLSATTLPIFSATTKESEIKEIGSAYVEGHYSCGGYFQSIDFPENHRFVAKFKQSFEEDQVISSVMFNTYIGTKLILEKLAKLNKDEPLHFKFYESKFFSPSGLLYIEKGSNHFARSIKIGKAQKDGQFAVVWDSKELISVKYSNADSGYNLLEWTDIFSNLNSSPKHPIFLINHCDEVIYMNGVAKSLFPYEKEQIVSFETIRRTYINCEFKIESMDNSNNFRKVTITNELNIPKVESVMEFGEISTLNSSYKEQLYLAEAAANSDANVLILGETGTGKDILANEIHKKSKRNKGPLITINAASIPRELIASELFGYVDGAFTGASKKGKIGKFEAANGGTLFLDEVGDMPLDLQVSLLRVLENRTVTSLGDSKERKIDVRIIAATNKNLKEEIAYQGTFRADLFYRLNVISIQMPALRNRKEDIALLIREFISGLSHYYSSQPNDITAEALSHLTAYSWPGNIRELRNVIERSYLLAKDRSESVIDSHHLPPECKSYEFSVQNPKFNLERIERETIQKALNASSTLTQAAKLLGISRSTLYRKIALHQLEINL